MGIIYVPYGGGLHWSLGCDVKRPSVSVKDRKEQGTMNPFVITVRIHNWTYPDSSMAAFWPALQPPMVSIAMVDAIFSKFPNRKDFYRE